MKTRIVEYLIRVAIAIVIVCGVLFAVLFTLYSAAPPAKSAERKPEVAPEVTPEVAIAPFSFGLWPARDSLCTLGPDQVYSFPQPAQVVRMTQTALVVQVTLHSSISCAVWHNGKPCPDGGPKPFRLHFEVVDGKIKFVRTENPKHFPATQERWEWEEKKP
jgi:hypothetical protein